MPLSCQLLNTSHAVCIPVVLMSNIVPADNIIQREHSQKAWKMEMTYVNYSVYLDLHSF